MGSQSKRPSRVFQFQAGAKAVFGAGVVYPIHDPNTVVPGEYFQRKSLQVLPYRPCLTTSPKWPVDDPSLESRYYVKIRSPDLRTMGAGSEASESSPGGYLYSEFNDPFIFGFTGSHFSEHPQAPATPIPPEEDIVLAPQDDQDEYRAPKLSFSIDDPHPIFDFTSASTYVEEYDWSRRAGDQTETYPGPLRDERFESIVATPSTEDYAHHRFRTSTASSASGSYVHLTPQASSPRSCAQTIASEALSSSSSFIGPGPGPSNPGYHSNGAFLKSPRPGLFQVPLHVGPRERWTIPPQPKRGRKRRVEDAHSFPVQAKSALPNRPRKKPGRKAPLSLDSKQGFRAVREVGGACRSCHYKKCSCLVNPANPNGPCLKCIRPALCYRYPVTEVSLYREQDAPNWTYSRRWKTIDMSDFTDWASDEIYIISVSQIFLDARYDLKVRRFIPRDGDRLEKVWRENGQIRRFAVPPYAIANMEEAAESINVMVETSLHTYLNSLFKQQPKDHSGNFLWETYLFAFQFSNELKDKNAAANSTRDLDRKASALIIEAFRLWVACRLTSFPDRIVGEETLGIPQMEQYPSSRWGRHVPTPPIMGAQLECIFYSRFLRPRSESVRKLLDGLFQRKTRNVWLTVYLTLFVLLHSCAMLTKRDEEYARQMGFESKYANPGAINALQKGAITLLAHFHGVVGGPAPFRLAAEGRLGGYKKDWDFTEEQETFLKKTYNRMGFMKEFLRQVRESGDFHNEWYWISQLYDEDWTPDKMD